MKKLFIFAPIIALTLSLTACGKTTEDSSEPPVISNSDSVLQSSLTSESDPIDNSTGSTTSTTLSAPTESSNKSPSEPVSCYLTSKSQKVK